jgi:serine/threonine-protein kinase
MTTRPSDRSAIRPPSLARRESTQALAPDDTAGPDALPALALGTRGELRTSTQAASPAARHKSAAPVLRARTAEPDWIGAVLGSYRVVELIGRGGMGHVFRAEHVRLGREVALKLLRSDYSQRRDAVARFFQEARTVNRVRHRNIVDVTDFVELEDGTTFIIMELLRGQSLGRWAAPGVEVARALAVLIQICDGLSAAHDVGVVHRDLKPDNIIVERTLDGAELVKLLDFGVAKLVNREDEDVGVQTAAGSVIGTPAYMSPEQAGGMAVDGRSDIYSLGAIMYELFCAQPVFRGRSFGELVRKHLTEPPVPPSATPRGAGIDPRLEAVILRCLEKDPISRYGTIDELREALLGLLAGIGAPELVPVPAVDTPARGGAPGLARASHPPVPAPAASTSDAVHPDELAQSSRRAGRPSAARSPTDELASRASGSAASSAPGLTSASGAVVPLAPLRLDSGSAPGGLVTTELTGPRTPWWSWLLLGCAAAGLGVVAAVWYLERMAAPPPAPARDVALPSAIAEVPLAAPRWVEVKIESEPPASVFAAGGGAELCTTPCTYSVDARDGGPRLRRYVIRRSGYRDAAATIDLVSGPHALQLALEPIPEGLNDAPAPQRGAATEGSARGAPARSLRASDSAPPRSLRAPKRVPRGPLPPASDASVQTVPGASPPPVPDAPELPPARPPETASPAPRDGSDLIDPAEAEPEPPPAKRPRPPAPIDPADTLDPFRPRS